MGIRREAAAGFQFTPKILQLLLRNSAFEIGTRVHARRSVALKVNQITVSRLGLRL